MNSRARRNERLPWHYVGTLSTFIRAQLESLNQVVRVQVSPNITNAARSDVKISRRAAMGATPGTFRPMHSRYLHERKSRPDFIYFENFAGESRRAENAGKRRARRRSVSRFAERRRPFADILSRMRRRFRKTRREWTYLVIRCATATFPFAFSRNLSRGGAPSPPKYLMPNAKVRRDVS